MFGKQKKTALFQGVNDELTITNTFKLRSTQLFESYRTSTYCIPEPLKEEQMIPILDEHLKRLFAGEADSGNGDALDNCIFSALDESSAQLRLQRIRHLDMLRRLAARSRSDRADIAKTRDTVLQELDGLREELEKICKVAADRGEEFE